MNQLHSSSIDVSEISVRNVGREVEESPADLWEGYQPIPLIATEVTHRFEEQLVRVMKAFEEFGEDDISVSFWA